MADRISRYLDEETTSTRPSREARETKATLCAAPILPVYVDYNPGHYASDIPFGGTGSIYRASLLPIRIRVIENRSQIYYSAVCFRLW